MKVLGHLHCPYCGGSTYAHQKLMHPHGYRWFWVCRTCGRWMEAE